MSASQKAVQIELGVRLEFCYEPAFFIPFSGLRVILPRPAKRYAKFYKGRKQTVKRAADNNQLYAAYCPFCCPWFPKGLAPWHTTLLAKYSMSYAL